MNLVGIVVPGTRVAAVPGKFVRFRNGVALQEDVLTVTGAVSGDEGDLSVRRPTVEDSVLRLFQ
jgi:ATP-dependent Lhr-like helicase